jgi:hypothetical protein
MALLDKRPTYFVKGDDRRAAYYTVTARELKEKGYVEEGEEAKPADLNNPLPEVPVVAGGDAFDFTEEEEEEPELEVEVEEYKPTPRRGRRKKG